MKNDEKILAALLSTATRKQAAEKAGVSTNVVYARLRDPEFREKYDQMRLEVLEESTVALQQLSRGAVAVFASVMKDNEASAQTRLNAAEAVLRNGLKFTEQTDILKRLAALENARNEKH